MNDMRYSKGQLRGWIDSFLNKRGRTAPTGLPLYSYATTDNELQVLIAALAVSPEERLSPIYGIYWAAGYCLFVSEKYRRHYDASWSWQAFDSELEISLQPTEHRDLVKRGMDFWDRPIRYHAHGADYLGSLFAEGGLPWKLLQSEGHGFGKAIKAGLKRYHDCKRDGYELSQVIREYEQYFPKSFQNDEKYQLLARVAETLMLLAEQYGLSEHDDPASYLNSHYPQWRDEFPLPLEEENGYSLVNEWLKDAGVRLEERKRAEEMARHYTCEHLIDGDIEFAGLLAEVRLAPSLKLPLNGRKLSTTRIELALYEGEQMVLKLGAAYGRLEGDVLSVTLPTEVVKCRRQSPEKPLLLVCSCAGERLDTKVIQSSEVDWNQLPAVFVERDGNIQLIGTASVQSQSSEILLRIPSIMRLDDIEPIATDREAGSWFRINQRTVISDRGSNYVIDPGNSVGAERIELQGALTPYDTLPISTWLGWPRCLLTNTQGESRFPAAYRIGSQVIRRGANFPVTGSFSVEVLGEDHQVLARRKLGILPQDFSISAMPATSQLPARLLIKSVQALCVQVKNDSLVADVSHEAGFLSVGLLLRGQKPEQVLLEVSDPRGNADGVILRLPYPEEGVQLFESEGQQFTDSYLTLNRVLGMTMVLTPPPGKVQTFHVLLELSGEEGELMKQFTYEVKNTSAQISLFSLYDDMLALLSCSSDQDAVVRCRVETSQVLKQFYIRRYDAAIRFTNEFRQYFELWDQNTQPLTHHVEGTVVKAMQVHTPEAEPISIEPQSFNGITTGIFALPDRLQKDGPWLLYPEQAASIVFRPMIHVPGLTSPEIGELPEIKTLNSAARHYHPQIQPDVFAGVLDAMADHFLHSSWQYLNELKQRYLHLPLSVFEAWKHLARHPAAMALAVFRLEMDASFVDRLKQELAVIWEAITVEQWKAALRVYMHGVSQQFGIPEDIVRNSATARMELLSVNVPVFKDLAGELCKDDTSGANAIPLQMILQIWLGDLRTRQEDAQWPVILNEPLSNWIRQQDDYAWMKDLQMPGYMRSVVYMPIFAACLTAGLTSLYELETDDAALRFGFRVLSDFDRYGWYEPVYSATLSGLLHAKGSHS
jgi:hypothetical protein